MNHNKQKKSKNAIQMHHSPLNIGVACDKKIPQRHMGTATQPQSKKKPKTKSNKHVRLRITIRKFIENRK